MFANKTKQNKKNDLPKKIVLSWATWIRTALAVEPIHYKKSAGLCPSNKPLSYRLNQRHVRVRWYNIRLKVA